MLAVFKTPLGKGLNMKLLKAAIPGVFLVTYFRISDLKEGLLQGTCASLWGRGWL